ncbi:MAG: heat-inducible transcription repressor HrcA [Acidobacteria bacterium]|nr:heat-inducible transcription repressor HrcA [Acidobacteriota bacterium]
MLSKVPEGRSRGTLMAVIRTHIQTGEPVASRTVSRQKKIRLSPASIRNIMMELEKEGYLEQPHTSAGRIPTGKAYRFYASQCDVSQLPSKADQQLILSHLGKFSEIPEEVLLERTSRVLSLISHNLGVVVREPMAQTILEHIHFVRLGERRILVVLVSPHSQVRHHVLRVEHEIPQLELEAASQYLNQHFQGWELGKIRAELIHQVRQEGANCDSVLRDLRELYAQGMLEDNCAGEIFLEGTSNLVGQPELADPVQIRELLRALEEKQDLIHLLCECIRVPGDPLQVVIGLPGKPSLLKSFALIGARFSCEGETTGRLAILGPVRMEYDRVIRAIGYIGRLLQRQEMN